MRQRNLLLLSVTILAMAALVAILVPGRSSFARPLPPGDEGYSHARIVRLSLVNGDVQIMRGDTSKWEPAMANMPLQQGFAVGANTGRAEIEFENGSAVFLGGNSVLQFTELAMSDGGRITKLYLSQGTASFDANITSHDTFEITTPGFQVTPPSKSEFRVGVSADGGTGSVSVFKGKAIVTSPTSTQEVQKGDTLSLNGEAEPKVAQNSSQDNWDHWVTSREGMLSSGQEQTLQYTTAPFSYGMADLSQYGRWSFMPGFGYGWQPFGMSGAWAPFGDGQWVTYPGLGLTWVSNEQWGWVPYHYGQWAYSPGGGGGWMWFPGAYQSFAGAPVQWVTVGHRVGWTPANAMVMGGGTAPAARTSSTAVVTPVVVGGKDVAHTGSVKVMTPAQFGGKLQVMSAAPALSAHSSSAHVSSAAMTAPAPGTAPRAARIALPPARTPTQTAAGMNTGISHGTGFSGSGHGTSSTAGSMGHATSGSAGHSSSGGTGKPH